MDTSTIMILVVFAIVGSAIFALIYYKMIGTIISLIVFGLLTYWVGKEFDEVIGVIFFFIGFVPFMKVPIIIDAAFGVYNAHHKRNDERAINHLHGAAYLRAKERRARMEAAADEYERRMAQAEAEYKRTGKPIDEEELFGLKK